MEWRSDPKQYETDHFPMTAPSSYSQHEQYLTRADSLSFSEHSLRDFNRDVALSQSEHSGYNRDYQRDMTTVTTSGGYDDAFIYGNLSDRGGLGFSTHGRNGLDSSSNANKLTGIPPNYADEELLKMFLNNIIAKGLNEENDFSYVVSVYINHKKCFAFVELKSIELTTACLELDGVVYRNSVLKVQRANEYKPEAVGPHGARPTVKLSLPQEVFSGTVAVQAPTVQDSSEPRLTSLILQGSMASIERGAVVLLGFPFDEGSRRSPTGRPGGANGPKIVRRCISRLGSLANPELGVDIGNVQLIDIGDIPVGLTLDEAHARLAQVVAEVIHRGGTPFVIGGSNDMSYFSAAGLMAVAGGSMGVANVSSQLHVKPPNSDNKIHSGSTFRLLLEDTRFCPPRNGLSSMPSCDGKLLNFGCQGSLCSTEQARYMSDRNARTMWLSKDVRTARPPMNSPSSRDSGVANTPVAKVFGQALAELAEGPDGPAKLRRPLMLALNLEAISCASCPGVANFSTLGLTAEEALEMSFVAGADPNVVLVDVSEFNPDAEEPRTAKLVADMFYYYVMGVASRTPAKVLRDSSSGYRTVNGLQFQTSSELGLSSHSLSSQNLSSHGVGTSAHGVGAPMQFSSMQPGKAVSSHSSLGMLGVGGGHGAISRGGSTPMLTDLNDSDPNLSRMRNNSINSLHGVDSPKRSGGGVLGYW